MQAYIFLYWHSGNYKAWDVIYHFNAPIRSRIEEKQSRSFKLCSKALQIIFMEKVLRRLVDFKFTHVKQKSKLINVCRSWTLISLGVKQPSNDVRISDCKDI